MLRGSHPGRLSGLLGKKFPQRDGNEARGSTMGVAMMARQKQADRQHGQRTKIHWEWVESAPFRAHLSWLVEASGVTVPVISHLTCVPPRLVSRLLSPVGRPLRRLPPQFAGQLLLLGPRDVSLARANKVSAIRVRRMFGALAERHTSDAELALLTGLEPVRVRRLRLGLVDWIDEYSEAAVLGSCSAAGIDLEPANDVLSAAA